MAARILELKLGEEQPANMKVGSQIIEHLSKGLYKDPTNAVRELVSNSFDAEAFKVKIRAKPELDRFSITDDGNGMNYKDFDDNFLFISRSDKRDEGNFSLNLHRPIIGKIGIGFVSASIICDEMIVISSKKGEPYKFEAIIDFSKFRKIKYKNKKFYELSKVKITNYKEEKDAHYTIVILQKLSKDFYTHLIDKGDLRDADKKLVDFSDLKFKDIIKKINIIADQNHSFDLSKHIGRYWQLLLELANHVPVKYMDDGPINISKKSNEITKKYQERLNVVNDIKDYVKSLNFSVEFDGVELLKPILLPNSNEIKKIGEDFDIFPIKYSENLGSKRLKFRGYIYNQKRSIYPPQNRGIIIRIKNTAIGGSDHNFLEYLYGERMFLNWTFGEIYVEEGLEEAMNINRNGFSIVHPHYVILRNYLHELLHSDVFTLCRQRYIKRRDEQKQLEEEERYDKIRKYLKKTLKDEYEVERTSAYSDIPIKIDVKNKKLAIYESHKLYKNNKVKPFLEDSLILLELARIESKDEITNIRDVYLKLLSEWYYE